MLQSQPVNSVKTTFEDMQKCSSSLLLVTAINSILLSSGSSTLFKEREDTFLQEIVSENPHLAHFQVNISFQMN